MSILVGRRQITMSTCFILPLLGGVTHHVVGSKYAVEISESVTGQKTHIHEFLFSF